MIAWSQTILISQIVSNSCSRVRYYPLVLQNLWKLNWEQFEMPTTALQPIWDQLHQFPTQIVWRPYGHSLANVQNTVYCHGFPQLWDFICLLGLSRFSRGGFLIKLIMSILCLNNFPEPCFLYQSTIHWVKYRFKKMATRNKAKSAQTEAHITFYEKLFPPVKRRMTSAVFSPYQDELTSEDGLSFGFCVCLFLLSLLITVTL